MGQPTPAPCPHPHPLSTPCVTAAVVTAEGRTFPVQHLYLEDAYEAVQYRLDPDSSAALRRPPRGGHGGSKALLPQRVVGGGDKRTAALVSAGWGDEASGPSAPLNPHYDEEAYA